MSTTIISINKNEIEIDVPFHLFKPREGDVKKFIDDNFMWMGLTPETQKKLKLQIEAMFAQDIRKEKLSKLKKI